MIIFKEADTNLQWQRLPYETEFSLKQFPDVHAGIVKWPMSVIRLQGEITRINSKGCRSYFNALAQIYR